jgi:transcription antitermination factor NusG
MLELQNQYSSNSPVAGTPLPSSHWYALHTKSNFEGRVATHLEAKGIPSFLPAREELHQWKDRKRKIAIPLFPGYLFVRLAEHSSRLPILQTPGVARIVGQGPTPEPIPESEIEAVRLVLASRERCLAHPFLKEGSWVQVTRGPLKGVEGFLVRMKKLARVVISVNALSQAVAIEVADRDVETVTRLSR